MGEDFENLLHESIYGYPNNTLAPVDYRLSTKIYQHTYAALTGTALDRIYSIGLLKQKKEKLIELADMYLDRLESNQSPSKDELDAYRFRITVQAIENIEAIIKSRIKSRKIKATGNPIKKSLKIN